MKIFSPGEKVSVVEDRRELWYNMGIHHGHPQEYTVKNVRNVCPGCHGHHQCLILEPGSNYTIQSQLADWDEASGQWFDETVKKGQKFPHKEGCKYVK